MAVRKIKITLSQVALDRLKKECVSADLPLSTYVAHVIEHHARIQEGLAEMRDWEAEHGAFTDEEIAAADAAIARAEARARTPRTRDLDQAR